MLRLIFVSFGALLLANCDESTREKKFSVSGTIANSQAKMIYLENVPAATMQPLVIDSAMLKKNGSFAVKSDPGESVVYNLRLDQNKYPVASVINDVDVVKLNIVMSKEKNEFSEKYEVEGSPASQQMKTFMYDFNNELQKIFLISMQADTLQKNGSADSLLIPLLEQQKAIGDRIRKYSEEALNKSDDPALTLFELGYYQSTANGAGFGLEPFSNDEVKTIVDQTATTFPMHQGLASIKKSLAQQMQSAVAASWVGREAPDFAMPDVTGKKIKLSSFKGKY